MKSIYVRVDSTWHVCPPELAELEIIDAPDDFAEDQIVYRLLECRLDWLPLAADGAPAARVDFSKIKPGASLCLSRRTPALMLWC